MVRNILTIAAITIASLTGLVAGQQYEDFFLDTTVGHTFADPLSSLEFVVGTLALTKAYCDGIPACIAILYRKRFALPAVYTRAEGQSSFQLDLTLGLYYLQRTVFQVVRFFSTIQTEIQGHKLVSPPSVGSESPGIRYKSLICNCSIRLLGAD